jgi:8-oxo-dGTP pyrophosphatase MutT (NUDIX family)
MTERAVVCALIVDADQKILLIRNPRWQNLRAIPTRQVDPDSESLGLAALAAAREDLGLPLPKATFTPLGYLGTAGLSGRTGETTQYQYWAFNVQPGEDLKLPHGLATLATADEIAAATDVTWSTQDIVHAIFQNQEVAVAVVTRPGRTQTEYLVLWNDNYEGFFFPAARVTAEFTPTSVAQSVIRAELGYNGAVKTSERAEVQDIQFSPRWGHERAYRFHIVSVEFTPRSDEIVDLHRPLGPMDAMLRAAETRRTRGYDEPPAGWSYRWLTADELRSPAPGMQFTQTMPGVVPVVLSTVPPVVQKLRQSEGGIAFIRGLDRNGRAGWLAQWNEGWGGYFLIGGHREPDESFSQCVAREIREELNVLAGEADGFTVGSALHPLKYVAWSQRAGQYTDYEMHAFDVTLSQPRHAALAAAEDALKLRWLSDAEISGHQAADGRRVSETAHVLLRLAGRL